MSRARRISWVVLGVVVVATLAVGGASSPGPQTNQERVYTIADNIRCPQCIGQSVAESDIAIAREIRAEIARGVDAGRTDDEIIAGIVASYGQEYDQRPSASGVTGLVWILPVVVGAVAVAGLVLAFLRWRPMAGTRASQEDRAIVARALRRDRDGGSAGSS